MPKFSTHYDSLKVSPDAPIEVIQAAYRSLARKHHPDRAGGTPESEAIMKTINAAYEVLSDPVARARYDERLASGMAGSAESSADPRSSRGRRNPGKTRPIETDHVVTAIFYAVTVLSLLRIPSLRLVGLGMLVIGGIILVRRFR